MIKKSLKKRWTQKEIFFLINNYKNCDVKNIASELQRSTDSIKLKARQLDLWNEFNPWKKGNIAWLLEDNENSFYWNGFTMADGYINHSTKRLAITLSKKDIDHLRKFSNLSQLDISTGNQKNKFANINSEYCKLSIQDKKCVVQLIQKFNYKPKKTYNPPNFDLIDFGDENLFLSFFIGLIDGDGSIVRQFGRKDVTIKIKMHKSWEIFLSKCIENLKKILNYHIPNIKYTKDEKYCVLEICNHKIVTLLYNFICKNNILYLSRKWDKYDPNYKTKLEKIEEEYENFEKLVQKNYYKKEIMNNLNINLNKYYRFMKKLKTTY